MRLGLISDIHANQLALEAVLARCAALKVTQLIVLGDLVGYGPDPEGVVQRVMALQAAGAIVLMGNHDEAIGKPTSNMNELAIAAITWTRPRLSDGSRRFLGSLPLTHQLGDTLFVHADASAPARWNYVTDTASAHASLVATEAQLTVCGHVHRPQLFCYTATAKVIHHQPVMDVAIPLAAQRRWLAVIGAVGQPRDGNPSAGFAVLDTASRDLTFKRAPYDAGAAAERVRAAGLPERLAARLLSGH
jgi:diadenosine tetraphosphatase ApaH/serine/threonine PP2A family protein phosphatase